MPPPPTAQTAPLDVAGPDAEAGNAHADAHEPPGPQRHEGDALRAALRRPDALDERPAVDAQAA